MELDTLIEYWSYVMIKEVPAGFLVENKDSSILINKNYDRMQIHESKIGLNMWLVDERNESQGPQYSYYAFFIDVTNNYCLQFGNVSMYSIMSISEADFTYLVDWFINDYHNKNALY